MTLRSRHAGDKAPSTLKESASTRGPRPLVRALNHDSLTRLYDPVMRWTMREQVFKRSLVEQISVERGERVLDLGCGTGTLTLLIKMAHPKSEVVGIDADPKVLEFAKRKTASAGLSVEFTLGMSSELPYPDSSFDRVVSSLLFHHLTRDHKRRTLTETLRVLRPGGELHVADWGKAGSVSMRIVFLMVQMLDGFGRTTDNVTGLLPVLIAEAGFQNIAEPKRFNTAFGSLSLYRAVKPGTRKTGSEESLIFA